MTGVKFKAINFWNIYWNWMISQVSWIIYSIQSIFIASIDNRILFSKGSDVWHCSVEVLNIVYDKNLHKVVSSSTRSERLRLLPWEKPQQVAQDGHFKKSM